MSFSWKTKLQGISQGLNANLTDSAARLRQQLLQPTGQVPGAPSASGTQQTAGGDGSSKEFVRLPVESAKKLRWFDRQDLNMLIQLHLREKQELFEANAALRQALQRRGVSDAQLEAEVVLNNAHVDRLRECDAAVGEVLALAAQAEVERLREEVGLLTAQLDHMRQRLAAAVAAPAQQHQQQTAQQQHATLQPSAPAAAGLWLAGCQGGAGAGEERVVLHLDLRQQDGGSGLEAPVGILLEVVPAASLGSSGMQAGAPDVLQNQLASAGEASQSAPAGGPAASLPHLETHDTQHGRAACAQATAGLAGGHDAEAGMGSLRERCMQLEVSNARLQSQLADAQQEVAFLRESTERKVQELRGRLGSSQQHLSELLRVAQDGRLEAEARCEAAERRLEAAEARAARLDSECQDLKAEVKRSSQEAKRLEREAAAAEARAAAADAALQKARGSAEADVRSSETIAQQCSRIAELEGQAAVLQRQLAAAQQANRGLEDKLAAAEASVLRTTHELHELEGVVAERDTLAQRLGLLEARMDETRVERSQLEAARVLAAESEAKRARAEQELVTTARLAAALEARLVAAQERSEALELEAQAAEAARVAALQSVGMEVEERWLAAGADRNRWPPLAQEEMENLEARLSAMLTALQTAQHQAEQDAAERDAARQHLAAAEKRRAEAEEELSKGTREWQLRERQLEAAAAAAAMELGDLRVAVKELGRERDKLLEERQARERAAQQAAMALAAAKRRTGSGSIAEGVGNGMATIAASISRASTASSMDGLAHGPPPSPSLVPLRGQLREALDATDLLYLKNVLLKFLHAQLSGRTSECEVLLPAVATLLRASPQEFKVLREALAQSSGGVSSMLAGSWFGSSG